MKKRSDFFLRKILPVMLTLLIVASAGGALFLIMNSGFTGLALNSKIAEFDLPYEATNYSADRKQSITSLYPWTKYDDNAAVGLTDEIFVTELQSKVDITECAALLATYALYPDSPLVSFATPGFSDAKTQSFYDGYYSFRFLENVGMTLPDGSEAKMRIAVCEDGIASYELYDHESMKRSYTGDEVNSAYEALKYEALSLKDSYELLSAVTSAKDKTYDKDTSSYLVNDRLPISRKDIIVCFLCAYSNAHSALGMSGTLTEDMICYHISSQTPSLTYWDGSVYITWNSSFGSLTMKYSIGSDSITGMSMHTNYSSLKEPYDDSENVDW